MDVTAWARRKTAQAREAGFAVRPATAHDAVELAHVHVQVWREAYDGLMRPDFLAGLDEDRFATNWRRSLVEPEDGVRTHIGTDAAGRIVGFASAGPSRDSDPVSDQELYAINVVKQGHGSGLAHLLFDAVVAPGACSLWVVVGNHRAIEFYSRRGFVPGGASVVDERMGVTEQPMVRPGARGSDVARGY